MKTAITRFLTVLSLVTLSAGLAIAEPSVIQRGASIDPPSLDPNLGTSGPASPVLSDLVEGLVIRGRRGEPVPGCAESWAVSDDGLTYTFELRAGLKWSDGTPLTADDFVYSFRRLLDPTTGARAAGLFFIIEGGQAIARKEREPDTLGVSAPDPATVVIRLEQPAPFFIQLLANSQGVPVPQHVIEQHGRGWAKAGTMVSNGPYQLAERVPQTHIKLVRNPNFYAADDVNIDEVYWRPVQDLGAAFRQFRAGELDTVLMAPPDELGWIRENMPDALHMNPIQATYVLVFNVARPPFDDLRVRRALSLALDRDAMAEQVLRGNVLAAPSLVTPGTGGYPGFEVNELRRPLAARQAEARQLLADAGFGADKPLTVSVVFDTQEENRKIMVAIATMWRGVGVQTELDSVEGRALFGRLRGRDFGVARSSVFAVFDDPYAFLQKFESDNTDNRAGYRNTIFDSTLARANAERNPAARTQLLLDAEGLLLADQPLVPIYWYIGKVLVAKRVKGWLDAPLGTPMTRWLSLD
ncbi:MAG: peptide ABC transporter substrate-binding protein [Chromatiales bacterium]|nr:MAG: peptide ABC transporter substrate-binding protein [Chromatiales bacterium]